MNQVRFKFIGDMLMMEHITLKSIAMEERLTKVNGSGK